MKTRGVLARILALALGAVVGYFGALSYVFTDAGASERVKAGFLLFGIYFLCGLLPALIEPQMSWRYAFWVFLPALLLLLLYVMGGEREAAPLAVMTMVIAYGASGIGGLAGFMWSTRGSKRDDA